MDIGPCADKIVHSKIISSTKNAYQDKKNIQILRS